MRFLRRAHDSLLGLRPFSTARGAIKTAKPPKTQNLTKRGSKTLRAHTCGERTKTADGHRPIWPEWGRVRWSHQTLQHPSSPSTGDRAAPEFYLGPSDSGQAGKRADTESGMRICFVLFGREAVCGRVPRAAGD